MPEFSSLSKLRALIPGLLLTVLLALFAVRLAEILGTTILGFQESPISSVIVALIAGIVTANVFAVSPRFQDGIDFAVNRVLKLGIILLGFRLSFYEALGAGLAALPVVLITISVAIFMVVIVSRLIGVPERLGVLIGVGTAICGVSAIVATAPSIRAREEEVSYAIATITLFGLIATIAYPFLARALFGDWVVGAGRWLGTAIHDTSQVTGAGLVYSETFGSQLALDIAVVTKLLRNTLMVVIIPLAGWKYRDREHTASDRNSGRRESALRHFPFFVLFFLMVSLVRTAGDATLSSTSAAFGFIDTTRWTTLSEVTAAVALFSLVSALAAVGMKTRFSRLIHLGARPLAMGLVAAIVVGAVSALFVALL